MSQVRLCFLVLLLALPGGHWAGADEEEKPQTVSLDFHGDHTIAVPVGWKRTERKDVYQLCSADEETYLTVTKFESQEGGWDVFWKTRLKPDFPTLKAAGSVEILRNVNRDYRKHPLSIMMRYEGTVEETPIVFYSVAINAGDFFFSANFVGDQKTLPQGTDLPAAIIRSIKPKQK